MRKPDELNFLSWKDVNLLNVDGMTLVKDR